MWGLVTAWFYFFFRSNHLRSIVKISSTRMPETIPANTDRRKEYADNMYTPFLLPEWGGNDGIISYSKDLCPHICQNHDGELLSVKTDSDHIHFLVSMPPQEGPSDLIRVLKTQTSKKEIRIKTTTNT